MTPRRHQVLDVLCTMWLDGEPPTLRAVGAKLGIKSTNGVAEHLDALAALELIDRAPIRAATIVVTPKGLLEWVRSDAVREREARALCPDLGLGEEVAVRYAFRLAGERLLARSEGGATT